MSALHQQAGARHCADVAGAFSPGWNSDPRIVYRVSLDGPLWARARMSEATRARLIAMLVGATVN